MLTQDELKQFSLQLYQPRKGYRYSLDAILLARFCTEVQPSGSIVDLGAGCGIISLVLARINPTSSVLAIENNHEMAALVERNIRHNDLAARVSVHLEDIINYRTSHSGSTFDLVVSNPPFRIPGKGKVSPFPGRDVARHETTAGLIDFMTAAKYLVKPGGRINFIYHPSRLVEFIRCASELKLGLLRLRMVHGTVGAEAKMFLAELAKGRRADVTVEAPLVVYGDDGEYTDEAARMLRG